MSFKILTAEVAHESNTFSRVATDEQAFRNRYFLPGEAALSERGGKNTELAGFLDAGRAHGWQIDHVLSAAAGPSGKVTAAAFDWLCDPIVEAVGNKAYDGILLALHGAMVTELFDDGEGELLRRLREVVGDEIPLAITLDLHANVSERMCALANVIVSYKTYPHVDMRERGRQAGEILQRCLAREIRPRTIRVDCPMLEEVNGGRTDIGPMPAWLRAAGEREQRQDTFAVSINGGFASADIVDAGPSVLVTAEGDMEAHRTFAQSIADQIWSHRHEVLNEYLTADAAAAIAQEFDASDGPLIIADYADNPGAGAYGDSTELLRALLDAGVSDACFGPLVDADAALLLHRHPVGERIRLKLGGKVDPRFGGGPLELEAELLLKSDGCYVGAGLMLGGLKGNFGPTAVIRVHGLEVLVTSVAQQLLDRQQFEAFGIRPQSRRVVALKSMQHFRADFEPIAGRVIVCDSGALCTPDYRKMHYSKVRRPIFPLDLD